jgi:hypothetical protein
MKIAQQEFFKFMTHLKIAIPKFAPELSQQTLEVWFEAFEMYDVEVMRKAYKFARDKLDDFPSIATLKQICDEYAGTYKDLYKPIDKHAIDMEVRNLIGNVSIAMAESNPKKKISIMDEWEAMQDELREADEKRRSKKID